jgi:hypothetical protein
MDKNTIDTISYRYHRIVKSLNEHFYNSSSDSNHAFYVGSYGRDTEIFSSDVDMLFVLPYEKYVQYNNYTYNGQSSLLQEVKRAIEKTYSATKIKADGQIISISFGNGIFFEVLPAFLNKIGTYTFANSNDNGSWKITDPKSEINAINDLNKNCNHNLKRLCKMIRSWKSYNNVNISGILIDILSYRFIKKWEYKKNSFSYYDWMTRDFFKYLKETDSDQHSWQVMGSGRYIIDVGYFQYKATQAYNKALEAIEYENKGYEYSANEKWKEIYGTKFGE